MKLLLHCFLAVSVLFVGCQSEGISSKLSPEEIERYNIIKHKISSITQTEHRKYANGEIESNGSLKSILNYDSLGNITEKLDLEEEDSIHFTRSYKYDLDGNILKMDDYDLIDNTHTIWIYKYQGANKRHGGTLP